MAAPKPIVPTIPTNEPEYLRGVVPEFKIAGIEHSDIGFLPLDCEVGFCTTRIEIGHPTVREVVQERSQADGTWDTTRFHGSRAITLTVIADGPNGNAYWSELVDAMRSFVHPSLRPWLWVRRVPDTEPFRIQVRTQDAPYEVNSSQRATMVWSFVAPTGVFQSGGDPLCGATYAGGIEAGRVYNLTFNRAYPASPGLGLFTANVGGNIPVDWVARIYGTCTSPSFTNETWGTTFNLTANGGVNLSSAQYVQVDSRDHTVTMFRQEDLPLYKYIDFSVSSWFKLYPGDNVIHFHPVTASPTQSRMEMCWRNGWM